MAIAKLLLRWAVIGLLAKNHSDVRATVVTSISFVFETFSPYGMIRFFEFSDKGWNISVNCLKDMYQFLEGLQKASLWAVKLTPQFIQIFDRMLQSMRKIVIRKDPCAFEKEHEVELHPNTGIFLPQKVIDISESKANYRPSVLVRELLMNIVTPEELIKYSTASNMYREKPAVRDAILVYDATGYYGGAAFGGNKYRLGNPDLCRRLQREHIKLYHTHWSLRGNITAVPFQVHLLANKYEIELAPPLNDRYTVQQSVCFPKSCIIEDLEQILTANEVPSNHIVKNMTLVEIRPIGSDYFITEDGSFYILISIIALFLILLTCAQFSDHFSLFDEDQCDPRMCSNEKDDSSLPSELTNNDVECVVEQLSKVTNNDRNTLSKINMQQLAETMTINNINSNLNHLNLVKLQKVKTQNIATISLDIMTGGCRYANRPCTDPNLHRHTLARNLLKAFSLKTNFHSLMKRTSDEKEIAALQGLQVICALLLILAHFYTTLMYVANNKNTMTLPTGGVIAFIKDHAAYLVDMFFFLSGASLAHSYFKTTSQSSWQFIEQLAHFIAMVAHKICSITLPYLLALISVELSSKYFNAHSVITVPSLDFETCEANKWRNILFIENFFPVDERCMPWMWVISLEVQFFIAACLILLLAQIHPKYAGAICLGVFASSVIASTVVEKDRAIFSPLKSFEQDLLDFNLIFEKVWLQIPSYLLGMCLGYILYKTEAKFDMNIFIIVFGWIACSLIMLGFIFGFQSILTRVNPWIKASVITLVHSIWSMIMFWIILASISQYGGFLRKFLTSVAFYTMGRLSTCVIMLGPLLGRALVLSGENGFTFSNEYFILLFLGLVLLTYFLAFLLHLIFETPLIVILKLLQEKHLK